jgi:hypothetical protein
MGRHTRLRTPLPCLQKSPEPSYFATKATAANEEHYIINGQGVGVLFLKTIIMDVHHDLKGKALTIRQRLMALSTYMVEVKYDIKAFNEHITSQMAQLDASGEQSTNLIECLWQAWWFLIWTSPSTYTDCRKAQAEVKLAAQANAAVVQGAICNALEALQADE